MPPAPAGSNVWRGAGSIRAQHSNPQSACNSAISALAPLCTYFVCPARDPDARAAELRRERGQVPLPAAREVPVAVTLWHRLLRPAPARRLDEVAEVLEHRVERFPA